MAKSKYEDQTVEELRDELRDRDLQVSGNKDELVARLVEHDESDGAEASAVAEASTEAEERETGRSSAKSSKSESDKVEVHAGGHVILADPAPPTPDPIETCSVCGRKECPHQSPDAVQGWAVGSTAEED
jgi:hypothetical protein